ncbi:hypothetical protein BDQ94DRAFT_134903 [Aspergillus welwitschiae]|uniref:Uncharacterized protein n=1 Tax=Aspergillus welwitschiae TaxID=1341132 RepID=A0A3F3QJR4_9EURO|nr:hypothetical protein BDQ94DRAFT_134903 [Aspergillus welwitschiae]RDH38926.1 hypothetical protein BDQ94DRAFT_134903 [Aspergillus welwitschiae]
MHVCFSPGPLRSIAFLAPGKRYRLSILLALACNVTMTFLLMGPRPANTSSVRAYIGHRADERRSSGSPGTRKIKPRS